MTHPELNRLTAVEAARELAAGSITSEQLVRACLERIAACETDVQAWAFLDPEHALVQARERDRTPRRGVLHGLPVGVKDIIDTVDMPTEYGTPIYRGHRPRWDAACVSASREQGAVVLGKTVSTELANRHPARTRNPRNLAHTPGGSSSGSGAAVAGDMVPLAFGTQTGGSLIRPAAYCGVVAYKPTFGFINTAGVKSLSASQDTVGVYGRTVADAALLGAAVIGFAPIDFDAKPGGMPRVGLVRTPQWHLAQPPMQQVFERAAEVLGRRGAKVTDVPVLDSMSEVIEASGIINDFETARALGYERAQHAAALSSTLAAKLREALRWDRETYLRAAATARACRAKLDDIFRDFDVLIAPSAAGEAPHGHSNIGPAAFQQMWTLLHSPSISVPAGMGPAGLPLGLQVVGPRWMDERALVWAHWVHQTIE